MTPDEMKRRTKAFALRCVKLASTFPNNPLGQIVGRQLIKAGTSVAANYRASCMERSRAEFLAKLGIVEEEADETVFWIDFAADAELTKRHLVDNLINEGEEILKIVISSRKTARRNLKRRSEPPNNGQ